MTVPEQVCAELRELAAGTLAETHIDRVLGLVRPAIQCDVTRDGNANQIGTSRIGGRPDVPHKWEWPRSSEQPLRFMAQLRLEDLNRLIGADSFPERGLLSLFYAASPFSPSCREEFASARVYHFVGVDVKPADVPAQVTASSATWGVSFTQIWSMPDEFHCATQGLYAGLSEGEREELREALVEMGDVGHPVQLLGYPSREQEGCLQLQCERLSGRLTWADIDSPSTELRAAAAEWELLAQVSMDWRPVFKHDGYLHYWIRKTDLANGDFSHVAFTFECT